MAYWHITIHACRTVRAQFNRGSDGVTSWIDFTFVKNGENAEFSVFMEDIDYAQRLATAINSVPLRQLEVVDNDA